MSSTPNQFPRSSKSASSSKSRTEAQANSAIEPSSSAETMTDQTPDLMLMTPPTRMTSPDSAESQPEVTPPVSPKVVEPTASAPTESAPTESPTIAEATEPTEAASAPSRPKISSKFETPDPEISSSPAAPVESPAEPDVAPALSASEDTPPKAVPRNQPIPPASEPMQYRAIGLVRGRYTPSEEQFTRGAIHTEDGVEIDAVLLGRVMSLVKKHIDLAEPHLWVVYPRTRDKELDLHMQIVGVWEPEKLNRSGGLGTSELESAQDDGQDDDLDDSDDEDLELDSELETDQAVEDSAPEAEALKAETLEAEAPEVEEPSEPAEPPAAAPSQSEPTTAEEVAASSDLDDRYFSVRGEVVYQSEEEERLLIKIRRAPKPGTTQAKAFKVALKGKLSGKGLGYFWDFQVQREGNDLVVTEATQIGMVPPQKRKGGMSGGRRGGGGGGGRPGGGRRPGAGGPPRQRWQNREGGSGSPRPTYRDRSDRPERSERPSQPSTPRQPIAKPVKRRKPEES